MSRLRTSAFQVWGTTAIIVTPPAKHDQAREVLDEELEAMDRACSRFRTDSELASVNRAGGRPVAVSGLFHEALDAALRAAVLTDGLVDPTVGTALRLLGYDRDFASVAPDGPALTVSVERVPGWTTIRSDRAAGTVTVPSGVELDFGATAKALCADRAAARASRSTGAPVLVSLGGDVAVAGTPPDGGWPVGIADDHAEPLGAAPCTVGIRSGGLATSSTEVRRWRRAGIELHHLVDPRSGRPAEPLWRTVSVAAGSCLDANIASCAAMVMGSGSEAWLAARGLPARLVRVSGEVVTVGGWAPDPAGSRA